MVHWSVSVLALVAGTVFGIFLIGLMAANDDRDGKNRRK